MIRLPHALLINTVTTIAILTLWLQRIYSPTPLIENIVPAADSIAITLALIISGLTNPVTAIVLAIAGALFAAYEHHEKLWWLFASLLAIGAAASSFLKEVIQLSRPEVALVPLSSYGFPSTHATLATIALITISWFVYHYWQKERRRLIIAIIVIGWLAIVSSRVLLGVHSISDVLAGTLLGTGIATIALAIAPQLFAYWRINL